MNCADQRKDQLNRQPSGTSVPMSRFSRQLDACLYLPPDSLAPLGQNPSGQPRFRTTFQPQRCDETRRRNLNVPVGRASVPASPNISSNYRKLESSHGSRGRSLPRRASPRDGFPGIAFWSRLHRVLVHFSFSGLAAVGAFCAGRTVCSTGQEARRSS